MKLRTRFAPSPSGLLHIGNAYSALICSRWAAEHQAELLLRIEDIDHTRCRPQFIEQIYEDLSWLGLSWPEPVRLQSEHLDDYRRALQKLERLGVIYPCFCTRKSIEKEMQQMAIAPHTEDQPLAYPGFCRHLSVTERELRMQSETFAWRLDIGKAMALADQPICWRDDVNDLHQASIDHDIVIGRKDISFSYHLSVVVDDAIQGITHVIRGEDLCNSTAIHRLLQILLELPEPIYIHHRLIRTKSGERLAKRNGATTLAGLREMGINAGELNRFILHLPGLIWPFEETQGNTPARELLHLLGNS